MSSKFLAALSAGAQRHSALVSCRLRAGSYAAPAFGALAAFDPPDVLALVGIRAELAASWLDLGDLRGPAEIPAPGSSRSWPRANQSDFVVQLSSPEYAPILAGLRALDTALAPWTWRDEEVLGEWDGAHHEPLGFRERAATGQDAARAVLVQEGPGAGGTWLLSMRFEVDRKRFTARTTRDQERIVGTHPDGVPLQDRPRDAHAAILHAYGKTLLRRGFPYRTDGKDGLVFIAAARSHERLIDSVRAMSEGGDRLMHYADPLSAAICFVPAELTGFAAWS